MEPLIKQTPTSSKQTPLSTGPLPRPGGGLMNSPLSFQLQQPLNVQTPNTQAIANVQAPLVPIQATHSPDGFEVDVKPLLHIVEDIFIHSAPTVDAIVSPGVLHGNAETLDHERTYQTNIDVVDSIAYLIDKLTCELACRCSGGGDAHSTTMSILNTLSSHSWDSKLMIALAAFAVKYGEFWLVAQTYNTNNLAKSVAILKQLPEILERSSSLKPRFEAIRNLIKAMVDITKCIINFRDLPAHYITIDVPALSAATSHVPIAVYWTIRGMVACATQIAGLSGMGHEFLISTTESWELSSMTHKINNMHSHLQGLLESCFKYIAEKKHVEAYQNLIHMVEISHIDNMRVLKALLNPKDDPLPLLDGASKRRVNLEGLRRKYVLLLISDLDIALEELSILEQIYNESRMHPSRTDSQYEVVWLPIIDPVATPWTDAKQKQFEMLQSNMPWYTVHHPSQIDQPVIKFTKAVWHFTKKPILVVLDPQARVASPNALHMMWIWGTLAFPFTTAREEALWKEESWRLELLVDGIDPTILNWISEGRYICLYGGEDIEWIRKFTNTAKAVAQASGIELALLYVGKSNPKDRVRRIINTINAEKLSHCWQDLTLVWYFWVRIESMWHSKTQLGRSPENDTIMQQIMAMLSFDGSEGGWALLSRGSGEMTKAKGPLFLTAMSDYTAWKEDVNTKGFLQAVHDYLKGLHTPHHCNRLVLPGFAGTIPENIVCAECGRPMEKFFMYQCCDE
ncbi:hypothetical protein ACFE04_009023 [Oxalis oulophora]